jgi:cbb3-type cytochrome oxidase maturation protein
MESLYFLIPIALVFCALAIWLLLWAIDNGQYDDLDKEAWKILADDNTASPTSDEATRDVATPDVATPDVATSDETRDQSSTS